MEQAKVIEYPAYTDQNNKLYIPEMIAFIYKIKNNKNMVMINNNKYVEVNKEDIEEITKKSNNTRIPQYKKCNLVNKKLDNPYIKPMHQAPFRVYVDQDSKLYIDGQFAKAQRITNKGTPIIIGNRQYVEIVKEDIQTIINNTRYFRIPQYLSCYVEGRKDDNKVTNQNFINYYEDIDDKTLYIDGNAYKLCRQNNIEVSKYTKTANGKNYYGILKENLEKLIQVTGYKAGKQSIIFKNSSSMKINICKIDDKLYMPKGLYSKYSSADGKKQIRVDGVIYVQVTEAELEKTRISYNYDGIDTKINEIKVVKNTKDNTNDNPTKDSKEDSPKKNSNRDELFAGARKAGDTAVEEDEILIQIRKELEEINKKLDELADKEKKADERAREIGKASGFAGDKYIEAIKERDQVYQDYSKIQSESIRKKIQYENREIEIYKNAYSKYYQDNKDKYIEANKVAKLDMPKSNMHNDITKRTVEVPTEPKISQENTQEALKRINELKEMLEKPDDTLMLPESIKK